MSLDQRMVEVLNEQKSGQHIGWKTISALLFILIVSLSLTFSLDYLKNGVSFPLLASTSSEPKEVSITNISATSFVVSWKTDGKVTGYVEYGTDVEELNSKATAEGEFGVKTNEHLVAVKNLKPNTLYYYRIVSDGKTYSGWEGNLFYPIRTASEEN